MLYSMTGYGRATSTFQNKSISIEIKSLNSKFTDVRLRLPQNFKEKEIELRRMIQEELDRGKLEFSLDISSLSMEEAQELVLLVNGFLQQPDDLNRHKINQERYARTTPRQRPPTDQKKA